MIRFLIRFAKVLPRELDKLHLQWALREIDPMHPDVPLILRRLSELRA